MMELLRIGLIKKVHGLKGEVKVLTLTDNPQRFKKVKTVYLDQEETAYQTEHSAITPKDVILKLVGIDTVEQAQG
ncbi:MAG: hypothetical protein J6W76_01585, partial [Spirochaetales bacterium]|nr:hypothetical protein [Spirochaetales bacterium]